MWFAVDEGAVADAAARVAAAADRLAQVDGGGLADAVRAAMPGSRSAASADTLLAVSREVTAEATRLADDSGRLRLAASQYAAADAVTRASVAATEPGG